MVTCSYPTIARFDAAYYTIFKCNLKMIRHDYPNIQKWFLNIYYGEDDGLDAFSKTTNFKAVSGIARSKAWAAC